MPPRILILTASVGAGHLRAAQAVELALKQIAPAAQVRNVDVLTLTNGVFRRLYGTAYLDLVNKAPHVLGYFYDLLDKAPSPRRRSDRLRLLVQRLNLARFERLLHAEPWDAVVNTHFLPAEIIASLRKRRKLDLPQMTVTTDFETHRLWVNQPCERYTTATEEGARTLHRWDVPSEDCVVTGIPIHPLFSETKARGVCVARQGLKGEPGTPIVLLLAGGFGVGPIEAIYREILAIDRALEVVAVTGKNATLKAQLGKVAVPARHRVTILGYTTDMDELMAAADIVVSKPGGLTTSEILARGAAMAIVNPIPGQESRNSDFLLENGAAIKINSVATLAFKLGALLADPVRIAQLKANAARLGRPRAAFDVAREALALAARAR
jgi:processive 1,2-diacylglycerol beta-glucosyltransferase